LNSRAKCAEILAAWLATGDFPDRLMNNVATDRAFVMEVVFGTVKRKRSLEWLVRQCAAGKPEKAALPFLMIGIYQALFMTDVVDYAWVNETVEASKKKLSRAGAGFVNAVLRRVSREKAELMAELKRQPLAIRESHPDELIERWKERYSSGGTMRLCKWNNLRPDVVLCLDPRRTGADDYLKRLKEAGIEATAHPRSPGMCITLPHGVKAADLPGYGEGWFVILDPSMLTPVSLLGVKPGHDVLDACAAPGGKTALLARALDGNGRLVAMDLRQDRIGVLRENMARLGETRVEIREGDAAQARELFGAGSFDRILVDAPCTNTGVLRRRPDARWRFEKQRLFKMQGIQRSILDGVVPLLKTGGALVYCVCSMEPEEGAELLADWEKTHREYRVERQESLFPPETQTDGIYCARIVRRAL